MEPEDETDQVKILCLSCAAENEEFVNFCQDCGAPITPYASTGPIESVWAQGAVMRSAVAVPRTWKVVVGTWFVFGMFLVQGGVMVYYSVVWLQLGSVMDARVLGWETAASLVQGVFYLATGLLGLGLVTRNYFRQRATRDDTAHPV